VKFLVIVGALVLTGCCDPAAPPPDFAVLDVDWRWQVQLGDGRRCTTPFAFWVMERAEQAIAECQAAVPR